QAVEPGAPAFRAVVDRFGPGVVGPSGALDRRRLGAIVFADPEARRDLERIVHPHVRQAMEAWFARLAPGHPFAVADIPLLYETGRDREFDVVVVAACAPETQVARVMARDRLTEAEARQRLAAQLPIEEKVRRADHVIRTDGPFEETRKQVRDLWARLRSG
ncbi:MAG TPA: dephospho-CoA kinase, partial [Vicinamibacterales bacterium]|nr:dephospho-CoA kinase [Vicinamibacterales bacterium]